MAKLVMQLDELSCPSCLQKIEAAVEQQVGVKTVKVLFNASKVKTEYDETATNPEQLAQVVTNLGYTVQNIKVK
ncbi:heavy-metal-associated domain-containing protein [Latilactobacillus fuchuensis]|jgi:copper chaperone CopZ|nr:heavy-metal-associated domain-containing protein [Latilactobacillus fuchuensis]MCP8857533.1 heavy-metal-associated domain-containing protein [Latilactobacillus fuchuensis]SPC39995.1 Heavy metal-chaperone/transport protein [Latilactobacillus fuchuensis]